VASGEQREGLQGFCAAPGEPDEVGAKGENSGFCGGGYLPAGSEVASGGEEGLGVGDKPCGGGRGFVECLLYFAGNAVGEGAVAAVKGG